MINAMLKNARGAAAAACLLMVPPVAAATITVTPATFNSAVAAAQGGDTLVLVGTFSNLKISNQTYASRVTLNAGRATFSGTFTLNNVSNLWVGGGTFDITGAPAYTKAAVVYGGSNITFNGSNITGSAGGEGIAFSGTAGATVSTATFTGLQEAVVFGSVTSGNATRNTITGAVSDGIDIADSHGVTASYNSCSNGNPGPGVHPDCVQLWSVTGQPLQSQIIVRNNTATGPTQGFTAFDSMGGEQQVQIINNTVNTSYAQGIACYSCINSTIAYNTLTTMAGAPYLTNLNVIGGTGNTVVGNVINPYTPQIAAGSQGGAVDVDPGTEDQTPPDLAALLGPPAPADFIVPDPSTVGVGSRLGNARSFAALFRLPPAAEPTGASLPEPSSWALLVAGFAAIGVVRRRAASRPVTA